MRIDILTLFPEMFTPLQTSVIGKASEKDILEINIHDIRAYTLDKHHKCDDTLFGGGAGMVMMAQPIVDAIRAIDPDHSALRIYMSPKGKTLNMSIVKELASIPSQRLLILCGHYEGVDQRALDLCIDCEISIGDYVLTGGEIPAMALVDSVCRYVDGVLGSNESVNEESFSENLLEYPQYTRPQTYEGLSVPEVLLSGHHANIAKWRREQALEITKRLRPDLLEKK
ncbi:MAG: tRNA (guanosine(37)-N1)-methyltransferase TrmD [Clostridia bacterium]|nr:tRNA (guanosine(37)-N1)-methyltransferase TrmD [Clostridia bacterium]